MNLVAGVISHDLDTFLWLCVISVAAMSLIRVQ
jgi:hypothetical protein